MVYTGTSFYHQPIHLCWVEDGILFLTINEYSKGVRDFPGIREGRRVKCTGKGSGIDTDVVSIGID